MKIDIAPARYDSKTLWFHWIMAILVVEQWVGAHLIDEFARGAPRIAARSVHISLGLTLAVIFTLGVIWRLTDGRKLPPADSPILHVIGKLTHWALYALIAAIIVVGIFYVWVRGDNFFGLFTIPAFDPGNKVLRHNVGELHELLGNTILILAGFHAAAALFHHYVLRDNVLRRMLPWGTRS